MTVVIVLIFAFIVAILIPTPSAEEEREIYAKRSREYIEREKKLKEQDPEALEQKMKEEKFDKIGGCFMYPLVALLILGGLTQCSNHYRIQDKVYEMYEEDIRWERTRR